MDSDDEIERPSWKGVPGSVILINAYNPSQLNTTLIRSFEAVLKLLRRNMRLTNSRVLGVCLYGLNNPGASTLSVPSIAQLLPLAVPTIDDYKKIKSESITSYMPAIDFKLSEVFWHCSKMFSNCKRMLSDRSVIILTRLDIPPISADQLPTKKRIVDLLNLGINVKIINVAEEIYDIHPFYTEILMICHNDVAIPEPIWKIDSIVELLQQHSHRHLALARLKFQIGENLSIGVGVYKLCKEHGMPKKIKLNRDTNDVVTTDITTVKVSYKPVLINSNNVVNPDSGDAEEPKETPLLKSELIYYQQYGGERIEFTADELNQMKNPFGPPMMKLLGFKPKNILSKEKWFLKECAFLFPNEDVIEGSTVAFKALHTACTEMSVIAICMLCSRTGAKPLIVALSPCLKPFNLNIDLGFDVIYIPYLENLKEVPTYSNEELQDEESYNSEESYTLFMKSLMDMLKFDYEPGTFENPRLQYLYRALEALALEEDISESSDTTKREHSIFDNIDSEMFYQLFGPYQGPATKRTASSKGDGLSSKKKPANINMHMLETRINSNKVCDYKVNELKDIIKYLKPQNTPPLTNMKKNELVKLVYQYGKG